MHLRISFPPYTDEVEDYISPATFEATFTAGSMVGDIACNNITIVDDPDLEGLHTFGVRISGSTPSGSQISTMNALATVEIEDNDGI